MRKTIITNYYFIALFIISLIPFLNMIITKILFYLMFEPVSWEFLYNMAYGFTVGMRYNGTIFFVVLNMIIIFVTVGYFISKKINIYMFVAIVLTNIISSIAAFKDFVTMA